MIEEFLVSGLINGGIYALLAVGFSLIFGVAKIINLAHTAIYMVSAYVLWWLVRISGYGYLMSAFVAIIGATLLAWLIYKLFMERIREHETTVLLVTASLATVFEQAIIVLFSGMPRSAPALFSGYYEIIGVKISLQHLFTLGLILIVIIFIWLLLYKTKPGLALRVTAQDREIANLMGIPVARICLMAVVVASFLAAIAGVVVAPLYVLDPYMWTGPLITAIAIVILGGMGSIKGSFIGAFLLAYAEMFVIYYVPQGSFLRGVVAMLVMLAVLMIRPEGLFGIAFEEERL
ncbi:MAG: branched-chain amino acid ABC transporter permease [Dehalococcoidia bacterium]|nr:MAG: branched-chain amino acid ABC transporter permease [Dehalococcoidia bacterium]